MTTKNFLEASDYFAEAVIGILKSQGIEAELDLSRRDNMIHIGSKKDLLQFNIPIEKLFVDCVKSVAEDIQNIVSDCKLQLSPLDIESMVSSCIFNDKKSIVSEFKDARLQLRPLGYSDHFLFQSGDIIGVPGYVLGSGWYRDCSSFVKKLKLSNREKKTVFNICLKNMRKDGVKIIDLENFIAQMSQEGCFTEENTRNLPNLMKEDAEGVRFVVVTNSNIKYGSGVIFLPEVQERLKYLMPESFYVLPSSINELIVIRKNPEMCVQQLQSIVKSINQNPLCITKDIWLSDSVYEIVDGWLRLIEK